MNNNLRDLFQQPFDLVTYRRVILSQLLHAQRLLTSPEMLEQYNNGDQLYGLGYLTDNEGKEIGLYYTLVPNGDVRRKRVGFRKMLHPYVKYGVDAAIAVFDDGEYWRLSYICDLKGGVTSAKRFSYVFGDPKGQYNTPVTRLTDLAQKRLTIDELHKTFSVDALSKEFFDEYHRHYDRIIAELSRQGNTGAVFHDYVKKLMGRIVFLHFLQKKGWLNDDPEFLRNLFFMQPLNRRSDFLEQVLEPLFFGVFNTEPQNREKVFLENDWDLSLLKEWNSGSTNALTHSHIDALPYLNGGLFERDEVDKMKIKLPALLFEKLFEFMASYNFTIDENDPDDADIGIDPEMLGKIFESLLEDNKAKGAFYTPKEIVRYMCKESLIAYLNSKVNSDEVNSESKENQITNHDSLVTAVRQFVEQHEFPEELKPYHEVLDTALRDVKICDPAIGSGAFPMGLLNELWRCREAIENVPDELDLAYRAELKKEIIENNIYGVDIERGAIDIARLRFWLSIVVDAEKPEPLPNFDYKFMQGNSLIESFEGHDLCHIMDKKIERNGKTYYQSKIGGKETVQVSMDFFSNDTRQNLRIWLKRYFSLTNHKEKIEYRKRINESVKIYIKQQGIGPSAESKLNTLDPSANQDFFLWHTWFKDIFDKGGFDIVIGNPPYINVENLDEKTKDYLFTNYSTCQGRTDIYIGFIEKSIALMNCKGVTSFIIPYSYTNQNYGELSRRMLTEKYSIEEIVDTSNYYVFDNAVVKNIIIRLGKSKGDYTLIRIADNKECFEQANFGDRILPTKTFLQLKNCRIETKPFENIMGIKENIEKASIRLGKIYLVAYGVRVNNKYDKNKPKNYYIHDTPRAQYKKFTEGKCIDRYTFTQYGWLNYCPNEHYNSMFPELFENEKLMFINVVSKGLRFAYDNEGYYNSHTVVNCVNISKLTKVTHPTAKKAIKEGNVILAKNYSTKFVLGIINSKLMNWYFLQFQSEGLHCYPDDAKQFPIAKATPEQQQSIIDLVDQILEKKREFPNANTSVLEQKIDILVYQLYNLTPEEIELIEQ